jgi:uncharacterized membrane-anchored protein YhcB (DUF1043 family)
VASSVEAPKNVKSSIFQRLPRLSTSVWLLIIVVLVLVAVVPMITAYIDATSQQGSLRERLSKLQSQYANLQKQLTPAGALTAQTNSLKSDIEAAKSIYGHACDSVETSQDLIDLAWQYDVTITSMLANPVTTKIQGKDYSGTSYVLSISGQVANFQNYLIALGNKFPSSQPSDVLIQPSTVEGTLDHATLTVEVICNQ